MASYSCFIDWDGNSSFGGVSEDVTADWLARTLLTIQRGKDQIRQLSPPMVAKCSVELDNVDRKYSPGNPGVLINLITNPSFETNLTGWSDLGAVTRTQSNEQAYFGTYSQKVVTNGAGGGEGAEYQATGLLYAQTYVFSAYVYRTEAAATIRVSLIDEWGSGGSTNVPLSVGWHRVEISTTLLDSYLRCMVRTGVLAAAVTFYVEGAQFEVGSAASAYCDGDQANGYWAGTAHASQSYRGSPIYGGVLPGRKMYVKASQAFSTSDLFTGFLDEVRINPQLERRSVTINAFGPLIKFRGQVTGQKVSTPLYAGITTDVAIGYVLDAVGWPAADRVLDTGKTTLDWWWLDEEDAFAALVQVLNTEGPGAALYENGQGSIIFESRHYRNATARCITSQATFRDSGDEPLHSEPFTYAPRLKGIINYCTITTKRRVQDGSLSVVWSLGATLTLGPSETRNILARASDPFTGAVTPAAGTDYTVTAGSVSSLTLSRTSGSNCTIAVTAGTTGATLTGLQLRAYSVPVANTTMLVSQSTDSQSKYGLKSYNAPIRAEVDYNFAQDFCSAVVGRYKEPNEVCEITVIGVAGSFRLTQNLTREISDRVTVVEAQTGFSTGADFYVEQLEHDIQFGGQLHRTKYGLERASAVVSYFTLNTSVLNGLDVLAF